MKCRDAFDVPLNRWDFEPAYQQRIYRCWR
jgi:hypothetical protein